MTVILDRLQDFAGWLAQGRINLPEVVAIPPKKCTPDNVAGQSIIKDRDYFTVTINEMFLNANRFGLSTYYPMAISTVSFLYGDNRISVPSIVGPTLVAEKGQKLPLGVVLQDTTIAGPYPYRGGEVAISLAFYRVKHRDYAKELLSLVEAVSGAIGPAADLGLLSKVGDVLIEGLDNLIGMGDTEAIAGQRIALSPFKPGGFGTCYSALVSGDDAFSAASLSVDAGRLKVSRGVGAPANYTSGNYILYNIAGNPRRDDEISLPFYPLYKRALRDAANGGTENWEAAKSTFGELWQQMILSEDLTKTQAKELFETWKRELIDARETGRNNKLLSNIAVVKVDERVSGMANLLNLR